MIERKPLQKTPTNILKKLFIAKISTCSCFPPPVFPLQAAATSGLLPGEKKTEKGEGGG